MRKNFFTRLFLVTLVITTYGFLSIFSVIHMSQMSRMHNMGAVPSENCPYMIGEQGLCPMSLFDHINAWQQFSRAFFPTLEILVLTAAIFFFFWIWNYYSPPLFFENSYNKNSNRFLYQSLFSDGILNPKAP